MTTKLEDNGLSWEDNTPTFGAAGSPGRLRVVAPIRLCLPGGEVATAAYSEVRKRQGGWTARGAVSGSDGTRVEVVDEWSSATGSAIAVRRRATVAQAGTATGVRVELRVEADGAFEDWQLFVPGALYNRNDTDGDGREDYLGTYVQEYRDDRLPSLAVVGFLPGADRAVAITRAAAPGFDGSVDDSQLLSREVVGDTDVGSLGLAPGANGLELRAAYPFSEERSFCLNTAGDGWSGFLPNEAGRELAVSYELHAFPAASLTDAIWHITRHQLRALHT